MKMRMDKSRHGRVAVPDRFAPAQRKRFQQPAATNANRKNNGQLFPAVLYAIPVARIKALMEAEKVAHKWPLSVDNCVLAIKIEQKTGDAASAYAFVADQIAQAIKKLHND